MDLSIDASYHTIGLLVDLAYLLAHNVEVPVS
jgi:hypothetical protein